MKVNELKKLADDYLKDNPKLKHSLKVFNISKREYLDSIAARNSKNMVTSNNSTGEAHHGNVRGNSK